MEYCESVRVYRRLNSPEQKDVFKPALVHTRETLWRGAAKYDLNANSYCRKYHWAPAFLGIRHPNEFFSFHLHRTDL